MNLSFSKKVLSSSYEGNLDRSKFNLTRMGEQNLWHLIFVLPQYHPKDVRNSVERLSAMTVIPAHSSIEGLCTDLASKSQLEVPGLPTRQRQECK